MEKVTKETFFIVVGPLDVTVSSEGKYPYTSRFKLRRSGVEVGRVIKNDLGESEYFLIVPADNQENGEHIAQQRKDKICPSCAGSGSNNGDIRDSHFCNRCEGTGKLSPVA